MMNKAINETMVLVKLIFVSDHILFGEIQQYLKVWKANIGVIHLLNAIISSLDLDDIKFLHEDLFHIFLNLNLLKQMKNNGFDFNFNKGCLINYFAKGTTSSQFSNLILIEADPKLLRSESLKRIKNKKSITSLLNGTYKNK